MNTEDRHRLRVLQDRLLKAIRCIPAWAPVWTRPIFPGGPSPAELERVLYPAFESQIRQLVEEYKA